MWHVRSLTRRRGTGRDELVSCQDWTPISKLPETQSAVNDMGPWTLVSWITGSNVINNHAPPGSTLWLTKESPWDVNPTLKNLLVVTHPCSRSSKFFIESCLLIQIHFRIVHVLIYLWEIPKTVNMRLSLEITSSHRRKGEIPNQFGVCGSLWELYEDTS